MYALAISSYLLSTNCVGISSLAVVIGAPPISGIFKSGYNRDANITKPTHCSGCPSMFTVVDCPIN